MNTKVTFPELVDAVATAANTSKRISETFLKELFALVGDTLIAGENVKIKHLGTFKLIQVEARKSVNVNTGEEIEIPSHNKVSFIPDKDLAEAINLPFSGFETVILNDEIPEDELERLASTEEIDITTEDGVDTGNDTDLIVEVDLPDIIADSDNSGNSNSDIIIPEITEEPAEIVEKPCSAEITGDANNDITGEPENEDKPIEPDVEVKPEMNESENKAVNYKSDTDEDGLEDNGHDNLFKKGFMWGFFTAMLVSLGTFIVVAIVVGFPLSYYDTAEKEEKNDTVIVESNVIKPAVVPETITDDDTVNNNFKRETVVKTDTISRTRFLTTMAREYYGNYNFWVYIYEENRNIIDNPNKIKPGTVMVIPEAEKYGIDKDDPQSLQTAKQKAFEIFKRYE